MGIRIHKRLGYALTDIAYNTDDWVFEDDRLSSKVNDGEWLFDISDEFYDWLKGQSMDDLRAIAPELPQISSPYISFAAHDLPDKHMWPHRCITHEGEFGDPSVLIFQALSYTKWSRRDDPIDYYAVGGVAGEPSVQYIKGSGIHPFNGAFHRKPHIDTPEGLTLGADSSYREKGFQEGRLDSYDYSVLTGQWSEAKPKIHGRLLDHLLQDWSVVIPAQIQLFIWYSGIFNDLKTMYDLKPIIYTYWT